MMNRFYTWFRLRFLPEWARQDLLEENQRLNRQLADARQEIDRLESYIDGMQYGMRMQHKIVINNHGGDTP